MGFREEEAEDLENNAPRIDREWLERAVRRGDLLARACRVGTRRAERRPADPPCRVVHEPAGRAGAAWPRPVVAALVARAEREEVLVAVDVAHTLLVRLAAAAVREVRHQRERVWMGERRDERVVVDEVPALVESPGDAVVRDREGLDRLHTGRRRARPEVERAEAYNTGGAGMPDGV